MTGLVPCYEPKPSQAIVPVAVCESYRQDYARLFVTALLISGSATRAERAIEQSIELLDLDGMPGEREILIAVLRAALAGSGARAAVCVREAHLPDELRAVLSLDADLRSCFVLRRLVGLTAEETARLTALGASDVQAFTLAAILQLAGVAEGVQ
jgi:DNA-directed RNA polymerase specialized sigma24 family protein